MYGLYKSGNNYKGFRSECPVYRLNQRQYGGDRSASAQGEAEGEALGVKPAQTATPGCSLASLGWKNEGDFKYVMSATKDKNESYQKEWDNICADSFSIQCNNNCGKPPIDGRVLVVDNSETLWGCVQDFNVPVRVNVKGHAECISEDGKVCAREKFPDAKSCMNAVKDQARLNAMKRLSCQSLDDPYAAYEDNTHWCSKTLRRGNKLVPKKSTVGSETCNFDTLGYNYYQSLLLPPVNLGVGEGNLRINIPQKGCFKKIKVNCNAKCKKEEKGFFGKLAEMM